MVDPSHRGRCGRCGRNPPSRRRKQSRIETFVRSTHCQRRGLSSASAWRSSYWAIDFNRAARLPRLETGNIASEPDLVPLGPKHLLVDTASLPGMSGSPVIRRSWTNHLVDANYTSDDRRIATKFIGVYSGRRLSATRSDTQLGMVWPASNIADILAVLKRDDDKFY